MKETCSQAMGDWMMETSQGLQRRKGQKAWTATATGSGRDQATNSSAQPPGGSSPVDTVQVCDIQNCKENVCKHVHMCIHVCIYVRAHIHIHVHICIFMCAHVHLYVNTPVYRYGCINIYMCVYMCSCIYVHVWLDSCVGYSVQQQQGRKRHSG